MKKKNLLYLLLKHYNQIADFYDTDISLYDTKGEVIATSISKLYDEKIIGPKMHPQAFFHLNHLRESQ